MRIVMDGIRAIRNVRTGMNVPPARKAAILVVSSDRDVQDSFQAGAGFVQRLAQVSTITCRDNASEVPANAVAAVFDGGTIYLPLGELVDLAKEKERLAKELENAGRECDRVRQKLENEEFTARAPARIVEAEKEKLAKYGQLMVDLEKRMLALEG